MNFNQTVTLFHKETVHQNEIWTPVVFRGVSAVRVQQSSPFSSGMEPDNHLVVRIPSKAELTIKPGDRVVIGEENVDCHSPLFQTAFLVCSVTDNRRGAGDLWHYKVVCQ